MLLLRHNGWQHCGPGDPGGAWPCLVTTCAAAGAEELITDTQLFRSDQGRASCHHTWAVIGWLVSRPGCDWLSPAPPILIRYHPGQPDAAQTRHGELTTSSPSRLPNFRHNNLLILKLLPGPRRLLVCAPSGQQLALSLRIIPGTGLSPPLSLSQPYLLPGPDHISQVVSRLDVT